MLIAYVARRKREELEAWRWELSNHAVLAPWMKKGKTPPRPPKLLEDPCDEG